MRNVAYGMLGAVLAAAGVACSESTGPEQPLHFGTVRILDVADVDNQGDGRDVVVSFSWDGNWAPSHYEMYITPSGVSAPASEGSFLTVQSQALSVTVQGDAGLTTTSGDPLEETVPYSVWVRAQSAEVTSEFSQPFPFTLRRTDVVRTLARINAGTGGMAVDAQGQIYMADFSPQLSGGPVGSTVYQVTEDGTVSIFASGMQGASGNAFDSQGNLFQSSIRGNRISKITPDGRSTTFVTEGLSSPVGIAIDAGDTLYVANCGDHTLRKILPDGTSLPFSSSGLLNCPNGIALADDGNLYVANFFDGNLLRVGPTGSASVFATFGSENLGHVTAANGVLYLANRGGHQITEVALDGTVRVLAGTGQRGGRDGQAGRATLSFPNDVAVSPDGTRLYFNDVDPATSGTNNIAPAIVRVLELIPPA